MTYLGDFIGQFLSEVSIARFQADLETIRLAELYASHPLLRHMPVPHMRLPEINADIPFLIKSCDEAKQGETPRGGISPESIRAVIIEYLPIQLRRLTKLELTDEEQKKFNAIVARYFARSRLPSDVAIDISSIADDAIVLLTKFLDETKPDVQLQAEPLEEIRSNLRVELLKLRSTPPRLSILATSAEIRDAGTPDNIMRLKLKVSEQGVEWTRIQTDTGKDVDRLVPE